MRGYIVEGKWKDESDWLGDKGLRKGSPDWLGERASSKTGGRNQND